MRNTSRGFGAMAPLRLPSAHETEQVRADGFPKPVFRHGLRRIPSAANGLWVAWVWAQVGVLAWVSVRFGPWVWPVAVLWMGRVFAQMAALMHEAAHRLLFAHRGLNDWAGRWLVGYPAFTPTDAYRRAHMAHHRDALGPDEPDLDLYAGYPVGRASLRRKLVRDATGQTGYKLLRSFLRGARSSNRQTRRVVWSILGVQAVLLGAAVLAGAWWLYPLLWLLPYLTVWRVINRLRSIAEHGGMERAEDTRRSTHTVRQHRLARSILVPCNIGWHLAHHVDPGVPFRHLPELHRALRQAGYVDDVLEYRSYPALWRALAAEPAA